MSAAVVALNHQVHANARLLATPDFREFANQHLFPVTFFEFARASTEYPLVFVKDSESGEFRSVALTGLQVGENLYEQLAVTPTYLPMGVQNYPLVLIGNEQQPDQYQLGVNTASPLLSLEQGEPLFEGAEQSAYLQYRLKKLVDTLDQYQISNAVSQYLADKKLLKAQGLRFDILGQVIELNGIYIIDEAALNQLNDADFADLRQRGLLPAIYAHIASMHNLNRLAAMKVAVARQGA